MARYLKALVLEMEGGAVRERLDRTAEVVWSTL